MKYMTLMVGEGRNNFILEFNENREEDPVWDAKTLGLEPPSAVEDTPAGETPIGGLFGDAYPPADEPSDEEPSTDETA
jgi:segregation and condensation protein A